MKYFAREKQELKDHLDETAYLASVFGSKVGLKYTASIAGLLHDMGKYTIAFQDYLVRAMKGLPTRRGEVIHALQGAKFIDEIIADQLISDVLGNVIASHHSGLFDGIHEGARTLFNKINKPEDTLHYEEIIRNLCPGVDVEKVKDEIMSVCRLCEETRLDAFFMLHLLTKVLFSCVVDADRCNSAGLCLGNTLPDWKNILALLNQHIAGFSPNGDINQIRQSLSLQCKEAGNRKLGTYTLCIPTGGGKTLSSLRFALEHAGENKLERVIYVIPYLSILDQTADELRKVFGEKVNDIVLEHHSNIDPPEDEDDENEYRLLCSRWDSPIVLTTMVQFLETIYSNKASNLRKFHNMANSVIVFDEVQSLPIKCTHLFNDAVNFLHYFGRSTILLCTATQPHFSETDRKIRLSENPNLVHVPTNDAGVFSRTFIEDSSKTVTTFEGVANLAASQINEGKSTLVILNTKSSARKVYDECTKIDCEKIFLTTDLCPAHRLGLIERLRKNLCPETRRLSLCVSTQLIEAGVDISFDCVIRAKAGLDSIIQAAGRCNRNRENEIPQPVYIVDIENEDLSRLSEIQSGKQITSRVLREKKGLDYLGNEVIDTFYKYYFYEQRSLMDYDTKDGTTTVYNLLQRNSLGVEAFRSRNGVSYRGLPCAFERAAEEFSVIDSAQTGVVVQYGDANKLIAQFEQAYDPKEKMRMLKKLQKHTVSVYEYMIDALKQEGAIDSVDDAFYVLSPDYYDAVLGLRREALNSCLQI